MYMKTDDFNYYLPEDLIAQTPLEKRDSSRLLVLDRKSGDVEHKHFDDVLDYLHKDDVLVLNDTKVIPARLYGVKEKTGAVIEKSTSRYYYLFWRWKVKSRMCGNWRRRNTYF